MSEANKNKPVVKLRAGFIQVAIWRNEPNDAAKGPWFSVTMTRSYQDAKDEWQETDSLNAGDLLEAAELLRLAWHRINKLKALAKAETETSADPE